MVGTIFATEDIRADCVQWGYPGWFRYVTGTLELSAAVMIAVASLRVFGLGLASLLMIAAAAIPGVVVLFLAVVTAFGTIRSRGLPGAMFR